MNMPNVVSETGGNVYFTTFKSYVALLTQTGAGAPVPTVLNSNDSNYLGDIVWTRQSVGFYLGTLVGAFTEGKTIISPFGNGAAGNILMGLASDVPFDYSYSIYVGNEDVIDFGVFKTSDFSFVEWSAVTINAQVLVDVRVYP